MTNRPTIFISHSTDDNDFTRALAEELRDAGLDVWVDLDSIRQGEKWLRAIEKAINDCTATVVVMSSAGRASEWVERETLMVMDLGKPVFIALIDDSPLPLHLINRQFTDFRDDLDGATQSLIAELKASKPTPPVAKAPTPNPDNFFAYIEQLQDGERAALIARDLYRWACDRADSVTFGGKHNPGFHANVRLNGKEVAVFSVWAYPRHPAVMVNFSYFGKHAPYTTRKSRLAVLKAVNGLLRDTEQFSNDRAGQRPTIPIVPVFNRAETLERFQDIMQNVMDNLRSV